VIFLEVIEKMFDEDETILWHQEKALGKKWERIYVISNKRIYYKSRKNLRKFFSKAIHDIIRLVRDVIIMERLGVSITRSSRRQSGMVSMVPYSTTYHELNVYNRFGLTQSPYLTFSGLNEQTSSKVVSILNDYSNIPDDYRISYKQRLLDAKLISNPNVRIEACHYNPNVIRPPSPYDDFQGQNPHSRLPPPQPSSNQSDLPWYKTSGPDTLPPAAHFQAQSSRPPYSPSDNNAYSPHYTQYPQNQPHIQQSPPQSNPSSTPLPQQPQYTTPSFKQSEVEENVSQIVLITDKNIYYGSNCICCGNDLTSFDEDVCSCGCCSAFYHKNCLDNIMGEGYCLSCNKILLW
jgi:hypothetical protein